MSEAGGPLQYCRPYIKNSSSVKLIAGEVADIEKNAPISRLNWKLLWNFRSRIRSADRAIFFRQQRSHSRESWGISLRFSYFACVDCGILVSQTGRNLPYIDFDKRQSWARI